MSVIRQANWLGQQRADTPFLRAIESSICGDFDLLAGNILAGRTPVVVRGFKLITSGASTASALQLVVADGTLIHYYATESGSIFSVPADRPAEVLNVTNPRVRGGFTPGQINFIGLDLIRQADPTTADLTMFLDANTLLEEQHEVPLARTLDYQIVISALDFASTPGLVPVAKVTTNDANTVTLIEDARPLMFRLGQGNSVPDRLHLYSWPQGRSELLTGDVFYGGDKSIGSLKEWCDAIMTRLWELCGGPYWYSPTTPINIKLIRSGAVFPNGEHLSWDGTDLLWKGLKIVFENSLPAYINQIADQSVGAAGLTNLADGECIYVDLDRTANHTGSGSLVATKARIDSLGVASSPGNRIIVAWRVGTAIFSRDNQFPVGQTFRAATTTSLGIVKLNTDPVDVDNPVVPIIDVNGYAEVAGITANNTASSTIFIGALSNDLTVLIGDPTIVNPVGAKIQYAIGSAGGYSPALTVANYADVDTDPEAKVFRAIGKQASTAYTAFEIEAIGSLGFRSTIGTPVNPVSPIQAKFYFGTNGQVSPNTRDVLYIMWFDGTLTPIAEGPLY